MADELAKSRDGSAGSAPPAHPIDPQAAMAILEVARRIGLTYDLDHLLDLIVNETVQVLACERASIFLYDRQRDQLFTHRAHGLEPMYLPMDKGIAGACARDRSTINVGDAYADMRFNADVDRRSGYRTRTILSCPMIDHENQLVGVVQAVNKRDGAFSEADQWLLETLSSQAAVALLRASLLQQYAEKQRLRYELNLAREIQQGLLPATPARKDGYEVFGWNQPADQTGGDGYGFVEFEHSLALFVADASGHGIAPALVVAQLQAMLRVLIERTSLSMAQTLSAVNDVLCRDLPADRFVTAFCGHLDTVRHELKYISAGQGPIVHIKPDRNEVRQFRATSFPLGIMPDQTYELDTPIVFDRGDLVLLMTDGFYEWQNDADEQFGVDRLTAVAMRHADRSPEEILDAVRQAIVAFSSTTEQADDLTAIIIKRAE